MHTFQASVRMLPKTYVFALVGPMRGIILFVTFHPHFHPD
jgi:hypothetical protein